MEIVSVGPEWTQKVVCGSCRTEMKISQPDLGWFKKTTWDKGYLGFRCGHCKTVIPFRWLSRGREEPGVGFRGVRLSADPCGAGIAEQEGGTDLSLRRVATDIGKSAVSSPSIDGSSYRLNASKKY